MTEAAIRLRRAIEFTWFDFVLRNVGTPKAAMFLCGRIVYLQKKVAGLYLSYLVLGRGGRSVMKFDFDSPPSGDAVDPSVECERQLRPLITEIVQSAVAAGWSADDVLLTLVELSWDMYEQRRGDL
jgi:hypothetical protein